MSILGMGKRGQIFTFDLMVAIFVFLLIFTSMILFIYSVVDSSNPYSAYSIITLSNYVNNLATQGINTIVGSQGYPQNWTSAACASISRLGIMYNYYEASPQKLYNLTTLPLGCMSQLLRSGSSFNITASYLNYSTIKITEGLSTRAISVGFQPPKNPSYLVSLQRYVILYPGNSIIRITYKVWLT